MGPCFNTIHVCTVYPWTGCLEDPELVRLLNAGGIDSGGEDEEESDRNDDKDNKKEEGEEEEEEEQSEKKWQLN